jgi:hypothetical protein
MPPSAETVLEVITPRTNLAALTAAEHFLAGIALGAPLSLEIAADAQSRHFYVRAAPAEAAQLAAQLGAAYPQAEFRPLRDGLDPAVCRPGEQVRLRVLELRAPAYLPLRSYQDDEIEATNAPQADPILGILAALGDLPIGLRSLSQLVLRPAPDDWSRPYQRLGLLPPPAHDRATEDSGRLGLLVLLALLLAGMAGLRLYQWYLGGLWLQCGLLGGGIVLGLAVLILGARWLTSRPLADPTLVREKVRRSAYRAELRLVVFGPDGVDSRWLSERLAALVAAYRPFHLAAGNGFVARSPRRVPNTLGLEPALVPRRRQAVLSVRELAGLWHLPHTTADTPLLERTRARRWLPMPSAVAEGCRIGRSTHQGRTVPVALPKELLRRHLLLVARTRRGKSSLLLRLAAHAMAQGDGLLLVDPHHDLAQAALGLVPPDRRDALIYLDVGRADRPFGLNLLDAGLGWDRDRAVANTLTIFQREWDGFWGPRMEDAFRFALASLVDANHALCSADPERGRDRQYTLLHVPTILSEPRFRAQVLERVADPAIHGWWREYFAPLDRRFQLEIINPVLSKVHRFQGSKAASAVVGQPRSTIAPRDWLERRALVLVSTGRSTVGEGTAALIGATLVNLVALTVANQAAAPADRRSPISILVDEFHTLPGADYELILSELAKYGANLVLATQSLARLATLDVEGRRALRATVFANLDGLFAFNCSAEDAEYLAPELGGQVEPQDLLELGEHQCYVRMSHRRERLPTFWVALDPPPVPDPRLAAELAETHAAAGQRVEPRAPVAPPALDSPSPDSPISPCHALAPTAAYPSTRVAEVKAPPDTAAPSSTEAAPAQRAAGASEASVLGGDEQHSSSSATGSASPTSSASAPPVSSRSASARAVLVLHLWVSFDDNTSDPTRRGARLSARWRCGQSRGHDRDVKRAGQGATMPPGERISIPGLPIAVSTRPVTHTCRLRYVWSGGFGKLGRSRPQITTVNRVGSGYDLPMSRKVGCPSPASAKWLATTGPRIVTRCPTYCAAFSQSTAFGQGLAEPSSPHPASAPLARASSATDGRRI